MLILIYMFIEFISYLSRSFLNFIFLFITLLSHSSSKELRVAYIVPFTCCILTTAPVRLSDSNRPQVTRWAPKQSGNFSPFLILILYSNHSTVATLSMQDCPQSKLEVPTCSKCCRSHEMGTYNSKGITLAPKNCFHAQFTALVLITKLFMVHGSGIWRTVSSYRILLSYYGQLGMGFLCIPSLVKTNWSLLGLTLELPPKWQPQSHLTERLPTGG